MRLVLDNVTKKYKDKTAVSQISAELTSGQLIGLIGKNGAGKTTLLKLLATIIKPSGGHIFLDGKDIVKEPWAMRSVIGYLPQDICVYPNLTAFEYLNYIASVKGLKKQEAIKQIDNLLKQFHLYDAQSKKLGSYSGGMKQRIGIICALLGEPKVIIIDEPTTGLDPEERVTVRNILAGLAKERIVILSTHIVSDIEAVASRILILRQGRLIFNDTPNMLISNSKGCVWEYTQASLQNNIKGVSSIIQSEQGIQIRQVSRTKPVRHAAAVDSRLEDACLLLLED